MLKRFVMLVAVAVIEATMMIAGSGLAFAVGGPNEAGKSGKFHPKSGPCKGSSNHPHCAGPH
jgi:hypothetical protein